MSDIVRTRFAPSPTGRLHVGNLRIAVFNWLYARRHGGRFVLRMEDTDVERNIAESEEAILDDLRWVGLDWDEGPDVGGEFGPYRQSERVSSYRDAALRLRDRGSAYPCYCSEEELRSQVVELPDGTTVHRYSGRCRTLTEADRERLDAEGRSFALRLATPQGAVEVRDEIRGSITFPDGDIDDFVIVRRDGRPTYNFAVVVDDVAMRITHVIRGAGHLSNTGKQALVFDSLEAARPVFAHLPLVLGPDRRKLSKREAGSGIAELREEGVHREAVVNYLSLLGWSPGGDREVLTRQELIEEIDLARVGASNTIFDPEKLRWLSGQHLARMPTADLVEAVRPWIPEKALERGGGGLEETVEALRTRLRTFGDIRRHLGELADLSPERRREVAELLTVDPDARRVLEAVRQRLEGLERWGVSDVKEAIRQGGKDAGVRGRSLFVPVRMAATGRESGPDLSGIMAALGRDETLGRITRALAGRDPESTTEIV